MFDTVITGGRFFDGTGAASGVRNIGITDGRISAVSSDPLDTTGSEVIDAGGQWVMPGLIDIHTHYDVEVLGAPALSESVRHGVTTILMGSCSLSTVHLGSEDAGDIFGRVEAIPRDHVIDALDRERTWTNAEEYIAAIENRPLGPNVTAFLGHSDMRAATMTLDRATRHDVRPTRQQLIRMSGMLEEALDAGFVGMSSQQLLFDKLDGEVCRSRTLPSTYAKSKERRLFNAILRRRARVLQSGPDLSNPLTIAGAMAASSGIGRAGLKVSLLSAADVKAVPLAITMMTRVAALANRLKANFRWQHLPVPFEVYADGISLVIFEEFGSGAQALHLRTEVERNALLQEESYRRQFRKDYDTKYGPRVWHRDFFDAEIVECPDPSVIGKSFGQVGVDRGGLHPVDAFLDLVVEHGDLIRWRTTISNHRPEVLKKVAQSDVIQLGFSDAGAHLRNMAFYNYGLRLLRHVLDAEQAGKPFMTLERAVHRMTGELAEWYDLDAGTLKVGDRADVLVVDPGHLDASLDAYAEERVDVYGGLSRMVNRNDAAVPTVLVSGRRVVANGRPTDLLGRERTGQFLRAGRPGAPVAPAAAPSVA